jgi:hypothetical protein
MNRNVLVSAALSCLLVAAPAVLAQDKPMEKTDEKKVTTSQGTAKATDHTVVGTVKTYTAGKKIKVLVGKKTHSFVLDSKTVQTTVAPSVAVGSKVKVVESKNADGAKTLSITPES